ncbi:MAG: ribonuclease P protein component [Sideroxydans sp.]|nr:ribonuclease P protein component [Sideroxydans sp.]
MLLLLHVEPKAARVLACNSVKTFIFSRRYRLSRRDGFSRILKARAHTNPWFAVHSEPNTQTNARLGVTVGKRVAPSAVLRNRIKRQIREAFRLLGDARVARDIVIRLRKVPDAVDKVAAQLALNESIQRALQQK